MKSYFLSLKENKKRKKMASDSVDNVKDTFDRALNWGKQTLNEVVSILPPPQAFLIFFLSAKSEWETGREQKGREWKLVASEEFERRARWDSHDSLRPFSLVNHCSFYFLAGDWG